MPKQRPSRSTSAGGAAPPHKWLENLGLIVIVALILAITITRYWHNIRWSLR
ncbi:MAG TPA: hypothetical protein VJ731_09885 [Terriglobales bacterium]|nr:hypothetical protein [Terriglobales bacterium]